MHSARLVVIMAVCALAAALSFRLGRGGAAVAAQAARPHARVRVDPTRVLVRVHPSLRVVRPRQVRVVRVHGVVRRARVTRWQDHGVAAASAAAGPAMPGQAVLLAATRPAAGLDVDGGGIQEYPVPTAGSDPEGIAVTANGDAWFAEAGSGKIGEVTPAGVVTEYPVPSAPEFSGILRAVTPGADGGGCVVHHLQLHRAAGPADGGDHAVPDHAVRLRL